MSTVLAPNPEPGHSGLKTGRCICRQLIVEKSSSGWLEQAEIKLVEEKVITVLEESLHKTMETVKGKSCELIGLGMGQTL